MKNGLAALHLVVVLLERSPVVTGLPALSLCICKRQAPSRCVGWRRSHLDLQARSALQGSYYLEAHGTEKTLFTGLITRLIVIVSLTGLIEPNPFTSRAISPFASSD